MGEQMPITKTSSAGTDPRVRRRLAVAALVLGVTNLVTLSLFFVGGLAGVVVGYTAVRRARLQPIEPGELRMALAGMLLSACSLPMGLLAAVFLPNMVASHRVANEVAALAELASLRGAEANFKAANGGYGSLEQLKAFGVPTQREKSGYRFRIVLTAGEYEITAVPLKYGRFGTGTASLYTSSTEKLFRSADKHGQEASRSDPPIT